MRLLIRSSISVVCRRGARLAAVTAGLLALGAFAALPAVARHYRSGGGRDAAQPRSEHRSDVDDNDVLADDDDQVSVSSTVNFRTSPPAILDCMRGVRDGTANNDTAAITVTATTVLATVTLHAPAGTFFSGQLTQGPICAPTKNFQGTIPRGTDSVTVTVMDARGFGSTGAFVSVTKGAQFEITPLVGTSPRTSR
jgi:hypothetical protein